MLWQTRQPARGSATWAVGGLLDAAVAAKGALHKALAAVLRGLVLLDVVDVLQAEGGVGS